MGYEELKSKVVEFARSDLQSINPKYVTRFRQRLVETDGDLEQVVAELRPLLGDGRPRMRALLTCIFDMDFVALKVRHAYQALKEAATAPDDGASDRFHYHLDHWVFQMDAYLERCDTAFTKIVRALVRSRDPMEWNSFEVKVKSAIGGMKGVMAAQRDPLAHGLGAGVAGVDEYWEAVLASPEPVDLDRLFIAATVGAANDSLDRERRARLFNFIEQSSVIVFAQVEALSDLVIARLAELDSRESEKDAPT